MRISAVLLTMLLGANAALAGGSKVPVIYGKEAELDACPSGGEVQNVDKGSDQFLALRSGPGTNYDMVAKLKTGQKFAMCDSKPGWIGIIVFPNEKDLCGADSSQKKPIPYNGPCLSGWVSEKYVKQISG